MNKQLMSGNGYVTISKTAFVDVDSFLGKIPPQLQYTQSPEGLVIARDLLRKMSRESRLVIFKIIREPEEITNLCCSIGTLKKNNTRKDRVTMNMISAYLRFVRKMPYRKINKVLAEILLFSTVPK